METVNVLFVSNEGIPDWIESFTSAENAQEYFDHEKLELTRTFGKIAFEAVGLEMTDEDFKAIQERGIPNMSPLRIQSATEEYAQEVKNNFDGGQ